MLYIRVPPALCLGLRTGPPTPTEGLLRRPKTSPRNGRQWDINRFFSLRHIPRRRRKPPILAHTDQAAAAGIVMDIIQLLLPEWFILDGFRMAARLPKSALAVGVCLLALPLLETTRSMPPADVAQLPALAFPNVAPPP